MGTRDLIQEGAGIPGKVAIRDEFVFVPHAPISLSPAPPLLRHHIGKVDGTLRGATTVDEAHCHTVYADRTLVDAAGLKGSQRVLTVGAANGLPTVSYYRA